MGVWNWLFGTKKKATKSLIAVGLAATIAGAARNTDLLHEKFTATRKTLEGQAAFKKRYAEIEHYFDRLAQHIAECQTKLMAGNYNGARIQLDDLYQDTTDTETILQITYYAGGLEKGKYTELVQIIQKLRKQMEQLKKEIGQINISPIPEQRRHEPPPRKRKSSSADEEELPT